MKSGFLDEAELVERLVSGDRAAFEWIYRKYNAAMIVFCNRIVRNRANAEEIVQDTWVAILRGVSGFERRSSLSSWIFAILINKSRSHTCRDWRTVSIDGNDDESGLDTANEERGFWRYDPELWERLTPERIVEGRSVMANVTAAIECLPPAQRSVLILRGHQDLEPSEICTILNISEGNMRVLLHRARLSIRKLLEHRNEPEFQPSSLRFTKRNGRTAGAR